MKQIIIFSEEIDQSTHSIMRWILYFGGVVKRINREDKNLQLLKMDNDSLKISTSFGIVEIDKNDVIWFRRAFPCLIIEKGDSIEMFVSEERKEIYISICEWLNDHCKCIGNHWDSGINKPHVLHFAEKVGLNIPPWIMASDKKEIENFIKIHGDVAIKPLEGGIIMYENRIFSIYTNRISLKELETKEQPLFSIFVQKYIEKKYELRIFFWKKVFFSMCILSQNDTQTQNDFRIYNVAKPNRTIPFRIPTDYKKKLSKLIKTLNLDTGSIDVLVDKNDNYFFLEINPVGQFGMVSTPCNFKIEKYIALDLIKELNNEKHKRNRILYIN